MKLFNLSSLAILATYVLAPTAFAAKAPAGIPEFREVNAELSRGGRPAAADLATLQKAGFTTIINLENDSSAVAQEEQEASALGLKEVSFPMEYKTPPSDQLVSSVLSYISNPSNGKIFIHCKHGEDRTGLIMGLYRIRHDHWTQAQAYQEMLADHFHPQLKALDGYFKQHASQ